MWASHVTSNRSPLGRHFGAVAELVVHDRVFLSDLQAPKKLEKFLSALRAIHRRIRHLMRHVVNVSRQVKPFFQIFFGRLMDAPQKPARGGWRVQTHKI